MFIYNYTDVDSYASTKKLRETFILYFVNKMLLQDEMRSKPGRVNWNIFKTAVVVDDVKDPTDSYDTNNDEDVGLDTEEDLEEMKDKDEDYGTTNESFANNFDVDVGEDGDMEDFDIKFDE
jgi:hypothetical protein